MERPSLRLPRLTAGDAVCLLPLSDVSAAALLSGLVESDPAARGLRFESALRGDPALTIWCAIHPRRKTPARDVRELAEWLDANALHVLLWTGNDSAGSVGEDSKSHRSLAVRAAKSMALAVEAERLVETTSAGRARLLAFLSHAFEWLIACSTPRDSNVVERLAPRWLRQLVAFLRDSSASADPAIQAVEQAAHEAANVSSESLEAFSRAWSAPIPWAAEALPHLTTRLARLAKLEGEFETVLRREKLAAVQKLAYGASHEINNPLANIATRAQTLLQDERDPERQRALATINDQAFRAFEMIANMMLFAKPPELTLAPTDLNDLVRRAAEEMQREAQQQGTSLRIKIEEDAPCIQADATQVAVLLRALLRNALEAVECGGEVEAAVRRRDENHVELIVHDSGSGLSEEARRHLFDPFYSSREAGRGLGFGLSWCWTIVELHQGRIKFQTEPGKGTTFNITLPVAGPNR